MALAAAAHLAECCLPAPRPVAVRAHPRLRDKARPHEAALQLQHQQQALLRGWGPRPPVPARLPLGGGRQLGQGTSNWLLVACFSDPPAFDIKCAHLW